MGGYGALKLMLHDPHSYVACAAVAPAVFPGDTATEVSPAHRLSVLGELFDLLCARPDERLSTRLARAAGRLSVRPVPLFLGVGDADEFLLHDGTEHFHRQLLEAGVSHHYVRWLGAGHTGAGAEALTGAALDFLGNTLRQLERSCPSSNAH
jgi:S-formylglutathione hydrolase